MLLYGIMEDNTSKPIKHIELPHADWLELRQDLIEQYGKSIIISWKMKEICGFTMREHQRDTSYATGEYHPPVYCLDFYDEAMKTWYLLKYSCRTERDEKE